MALQTGQAKRKDAQAVFDADGKLVPAPLPAPAASVGAVSTAPGAAAVVADTGALPAGDYYVEVDMAIAGTLAAGKDMRVEHRNAANAATLKTLGGCPAGVSYTTVIQRITLAANERIRVVVGAVAGAASETFIASVRAYPIA